MNEEQMQTDMTAEEAKASLGVATFLQEQLIPKAQEQAPMEEQQAPQDDVTPRIDELETKIGDLEKSVQETIQKEMGGLKDLIKEALSEDETD